MSPLFEVRWRCLYTLFFSTCLFVLNGCSSVTLPDDAQKKLSYHFGYQQDSRLDHYFKPTEHGHDLTRESGFLPLNKGHDALLTRLALIETAQKSLDLQYYIYRNDETSQLLTWRLYKAAERGVRVRLLLDDMQARSDKAMAYLNAHPNIEIRLFNPHKNRHSRGLSFLGDFDRLNQRMHNKSLTADNVASIVGGRNIGNEYFSYLSDVEFGDFDVLLHGNTVEQIADQFDLYWNSDYAIPMEWIYPDARPYTPAEVQQWLDKTKIADKFSLGIYDFTRLPLYHQLRQGHLPLHWGPAQLLYDVPSKLEGQDSQLVLQLKSLLADVEHSLILISPYFVPTESGTQQLIRAVQSGKNIIIVTNSLASNDVFAVHGWYAKYREQLVKGGVQLWETKSTSKQNNRWSMTGSSRSSLHAKVMLMDNQKLFVGSMNWDPRSALLNTEMAVVLTQPEYVSQQSEQFIQSLPEVAYQVLWQDGDIVWRDAATEMLYTSEPDASLWRRIGAWFSGILPIEDQL
ncbi:phospholipase D family protein [Vibrio proteolyticus]